LNIYWDNTYSMMRNKSVNFVIKVLSSTDFTIAKNISADAAKDKQRYQQQRQMVSRALHKLSMSLLQERETQSLAVCVTSASRGGANFENYDDGELNVDLYEKMMKLEDEKRSLQLALAASESALLEERNSASSTTSALPEKSSQDDLTSVKESLEAEMNELKSQFLLLRKRNEDDAQRYKAKLDQLAEALQEAQSSKRVTIQALADTQRELAEVKQMQDSAKDEVLRQYESVQAELNQARAEITKMDLVTAKLKTERKQLKAFAIQQKNEIEQLKTEIET